ncbi:MAG: helicase-related protein, partial [Bacteroidota bacterium]
PIPVTMDVNKWVPKEGADEVVMDMIAPITIRYAMEECVDMPERSTHTRYVDLPKQLRKHYDEMQEQALLELENGEVEAVHAASLMGKLQQIASGSVYGVDKNAYELNRERYDLIAELCHERDHTVVAFQWRHQRNGVIQALERAGIDTYAVIDGETKDRDINEIVTNFQAGEYQVLLIHPASAGHGLTFTRAATMVWASPTPDAELYEQACRRIYRTGQDRKTETIVIAGRETVDERVLDKLYGRVNAQASAFDLLQSMMPSRQAA